MAIHGYLCLALRHPGFQGAEAHPSRAIAEDFVAAIGDKLVEVGLLTPDELAQAQQVEAEEQPACEVCGCTEVKACPLKSLLTAEDPDFHATLEELGR